MNLQTTLNIIRAAKPCAEGWTRLLKSLPADIDYDAPISFSHILESNGLNDSLWALRSVLPAQEKERDVEARLFACDFAERVLHIFEAEYPNDQRPRKCLEVARSFANGTATKVQLAAARAAARDASGAVTWAAGNAVWDAAKAAWDAAWDGARDAAWAAMAARAAARDAVGAAARDGSSQRIIANQKEQFIARFCKQASQ
jgi:hypothetical protein